MTDHLVGKSCWRKFQRCPEVIGGLYLFALMFIGPMNEQYLYKRFSDHYGLNYSVTQSEVQNQCHQGNRSSLEVMVSEKTSKLLVWHNVGQLVPSILILLYVGPISDRLGRKAALVWNNLLFVLSLGLTLAIVGFGWNVYLTIVAQLVFGLGGFYTGYVMTILAYICDTTEKEGRSFRIAVIDLIVLIAVMVSNLTGGIFLQNFGFAWTTALSLSCAVACLLYTVFILEESLPASRRRKDGASCLAEPVLAWRVIRKPRAGRWMLNLFAVTNGFVNLVNPTTTLAPILLLFMINHPLCVSPTKLGLYRGIFFLAVGVGGVVGVRFVPRLLGKLGTMFLSLLSMVSGLVLLSFTSDMEMAYLAILASIFAYVVGPLIRGQASALCSADEQGSLWTFVTVLQELFMLAGTYMFQAFFRFSLKRGKPGAVFAFAAAWAVFPALLLIIYKVKSRSSVIELKQIKEDSDSGKDSDPLLS